MASGFRGLGFRFRVVASGFRGLRFRVLGFWVFVGLRGFRVRRFGGFGVRAAGVDGRALGPVTTWRIMGLSK